MEDIVEVDIVEVDTVEADTVEADIVVLVGMDTAGHTQAHHMLGEHLEDTIPFRLTWLKATKHEESVALRRNALDCKVPYGSLHAAQKVRVSTCLATIRSAC